VKRAWWVFYDFMLPFLICCLIAGLLLTLKELRRWEWEVVSHNGYFVYDGWLYLCGQYKCHPTKDLMFSPTRSQFENS
jgi:hypothetical protein